MTSQETQKAAESLFKEVKSVLAEARKANKEKGYAYNNWNRRRQMVNISVIDHDKWNDRGMRYTESYSIEVGNKEIVKGAKYRSDIQEIFSKFIGLLREQTKVKGWGGLVFTTDKSYLGGNAWDNYSTTIVDKVCLADAVCPEYKSLINYINKYGCVEGYTNYKPTFGNYRFFCSAMGGKRGRLWDEYGERYFLDNRPKRCEKFLKELREHKGTKDIMLCKEGEEDYIDEIDRKYSEYHEIECDGEKRHYINITIKTPAGKVKYQAKIY